MVGCRGEIEGSGSILIDESQALPRSCHDGKVHLKQGGAAFFSREKKKQGKRSSHKPPMHGIAQ